MKIIGILGVRGSGKDYLAAEFKKNDLQGKKVKVLGFSEGVRQVTFMRLNITVATAKQYDEFKVSQYRYKSMIKTGRDWLEYFGEGIRRKRPTYWADLWKSTVDSYGKKYDYVIASDTRFTHEVMAAKMFDGVEFYLSDFHSDRYDDKVTPTNQLALDMLKQVKFPEGETFVNVTNLLVYGEEPEI